MNCRTCDKPLMYGKMMCTFCGDWSPNSIDSIGGASANEVVKEDDFVDAFDVEAATLDRIVTGGPWDDCWGGGFVPSSITLLGGPPGSGKTSILIQLAKHFAQITKKPVYLISAEQDKGEIKIFLNRIWPDLQPGMLRVLKKMGPGGTLDEAALDKSPPGMIILDSISALCGNDKLAQLAVGRRYKQYAVKYKAPTFIIAHMTKESDFAGLMTLQHDVDVIVTVHHEDDGTRVLQAWKNRFGPSHKEYKLVLTEHGYEAPPPEEKKGKRGRIVPMPPPVGELVPRDTPPPVGEKIAPVVSINKFKRPKPPLPEAAPGNNETSEVAITEPERLLTGAKSRLKEVAAKSRRAQAAAIEGEALRKKRAPMPRTRDLKAKAKANRKTRERKARENKRRAHKPNEKETCV